MVIEQVFGFFFYIIIILINMRGEDLNFKRILVFFLIAGKYNATIEDKIVSLAILWKSSLFFFFLNINR